MHNEVEVMNTIYHKCMKQMSPSALHLFGLIDLNLMKYGS